MRASRMTAAARDRMILPMPRLTAMALVLVVIACSSQASSPMPSAIGVPAPSVTTVTATVAPTFTREIPHLPALQPNPFFDRVQISIDVEKRPGQPWEATAFAVTRPAVDEAYRLRVANAFGVTGDGIVGAAPDGTGPWRVWFDTKGTVALNEGTGDVLFFGPNTDDGPGPSGPAMHDPAQEQIKLISQLGTAAQFDYTLFYEFHGGDATASIERLVDGSWLIAGTRTTVALFPQYSTRDRQNGTTIYGSDELALFTSRGRLAELVHRPIAGIAARAIYDLKTTMLYGEAVEELKSAPNRYLRLLSVLPDEPLALRIDPANIVHGHAWSGAPQGELTHAADTLVPVWTFFASGTTASGKPVSAMFTVDAVRPEYRTLPASNARNITADSLLRTQLAVNLGGHRPGLMNADEALRDELAGLACASGTYTVSKTDPDTATASVTCSPSLHLSLTMRRAFPGYEHSIWYLSELRK